MKKRLPGIGPIHAVAAAALAMAVLTTPGAHSAELAPPPAGASCVEVIPALAGAAPAILLDRCSGETWQLVRSYSRRQGARYAWVPLLRQQGVAVAAPRKASAVAVPARPKAPAINNSKCFSFNGRTFCE
jgi:hypothetical protein